ncbi:MAG: GSCFA domain-containing protein [Rhodobacteraceae bacterium]|nr:GSCFA domain-containing protein [Paracoccaceae bacterium]MBL4811813.1 GSCFA domain-containing protein [Paracoccaceae bacterium]
MKKNPYSGLPDKQFWKKDPGITKAIQFDPVSPASFKITKEQKIVTAGSCFAQHVARVLTKKGFNHHITENAHPLIHSRIADKNNYGMFSARYGNIYTTRQLKQLLQRAYGEFEPLQSEWPLGDDGTLIDPFRPQIQPGGFRSAAELRTDRAQHFTAIRQAIEEMDVFIFTLGLTECWEDSRDGAIFPLAPGIVGGIYDPEIIKFKNFDEVETYADLKFALDFIRAKNPDVKIILTVSPVPLNATMENRHVFVSTTWSKAVLRIAAEKAHKTLEDCYYFPSYEVITSPHMRGRYYDDSRRDVTQPGVQHVMRLFMRHICATGHGPAAQPIETPAHDRHIKAMSKALDTLCDEAAITND